MCRGRNRHPKPLEKRLTNSYVPARDVSKSTLAEITNADSMGSLSGSREVFQRLYAPDPQNIGRPVLLSSGVLGSL